MANILVVDDDRTINSALSRTIKSESGCDVESCFELAQGLQNAREREYDLIFLDVRLPDGDGLEALPIFKNMPSNPEIIILTGFADEEGVELAINHGAWDYLKKPFDKEEILSALRQALQYRQDKSNSKPPPPLVPENIVGTSPEIRKCCEQVQQSVSLNCNILLTGETGTGKELFAEAIHNHGQRSSSPLVVVDCTVLPEKLVESYLFGHEKGAFTGADIPHVGLIQKADGGTLFLDEIGELPLNIQQKFLRVLETRRFRPVGGKKGVSSDFRLVSATHRNIERMVKDKTFREDLFYRIRGVSIHLPPLRERLADIPELAAYHMEKIANRTGLSPKKLSPEFLYALQDYCWPGNIRELATVLEIALINAKDSPRLYTCHFSDDFRIAMIQGRICKNEPENGSDSEESCGQDKLPTLKNYRGKKVARIEKEYLLALMKTTGGDWNVAQKLSGLSKSRLYQLLQKHGIGKPAFSEITDD